MQNKLLKIARMGFALAVLSFGALPAMAQYKLDELKGICSDIPKDMNNTTTEEISKELRGMIKRGFDINERVPNNGLTVFYGIAGCLKVNVVSAFLQIGANVNARDTHLGITPLHVAAIFNTDPEVIIALVRAGAKVNIRTMDGRTPLHLAALNNTNPDVIMTLLKVGASGRVFDSTLNTPFALAKENKAIKGTEAYWALSDAQYE